MKLEYNLELRQSQKLLMTPQLQQAIKLLQLPTLELAVYLENQYMENPLLELAESEDDQLPEEESGQEEQLPDIDWDLYFADSGGIGEPINREPKAAFEQFVAAGENNLRESLLAQLNLLALSTEQRQISTYIIDNLDNRGYLQISCYDIAKALNFSTGAVIDGLRVVQGLEPAGIGARDLRECLLIQMQQRRDVPPCAREIVSQHLLLLAKGRVPVLAERLRASTAAIQAAIDYIRQMDPRPGLSLAGERNTAYIYPDVTVLAVAGKWIVLVNDSNTPRLRLSPAYRQLLRSAQTAGTKKFLRERFNAALWLLKAVEQRRNTLHRITEFIVDYQEDFFRQGVKAMRPLRLRDVAEALEIHESTVSRAISGKYVQTPRGLYELKYFFSVNLATRDGCGTSSTGVKQQLQEIVERENRGRPLTDQQLAEQLQQRGVKISRRTVAKYREELAIASSTLRRRWD